MIHICNVYCRTIDAEQLESLNLKDEGKWLPFCLKIDIVDAIKLASDDPEELSYNCTTLFCNTGDTYIIDTPFDLFQPIFIKENIKGELPNKQDKEEPSF